MSSGSSPRTPNDLESDIDFSVYSLSSDLDLDFGFRGTAKPAAPADSAVKFQVTDGRVVESLLVLTAKSIASLFPFEVVESSPLLIPEELQRLIAFYSFPTDEDDIWLYSCLSSGGSYEFDQGEALWADKAVKECVQIGFHLSAKVLTSLHIALPHVSHANEDEREIGTNPPTSSANFEPFHLNWDPSLNSNRPQLEANLSGNTVRPTEQLHHPGVNIEPGYPAHRVSLTFDRGRITSCSCTCTFDVEDGCANFTPHRDVLEERGGHDSFPDAGPPTRTRTQPSNSFSYQPMFAADSAESDRGRGIIMGSFNNNASSHQSTTGSRPLNPVRFGLVRPGLRSHQTTVYQQHPRINAGVQRSNLTGEPSTTNPFRSLAFPSGCSPPSSAWCSHVVATCLMRIRQPDKVLLRAPISESLSKLSKEDLQKFAQNLICHVGPKKILPAAQRILDQLLAATDNPMKSSVGAPDPTAGGAVGDAAAWCFDGAVLEEKLRLALRRFWVSTPSVIYSDIGSLNSSSPPDVENFHSVLHSLRGNDPGGVWDLLSIIGDMMRRQDNNGVLLLEIVTRCIIDMQELMFWWYLVQLKPCVLPKGIPICQKQTQYAALWLCEQVVQLWRLACLNPELRPQTTGHLAGRFPSGSSVISVCSSKDTNASTSGPVGCWLLQQLNRRLRAFHIFALEQAGVRIAQERDPQTSQKGEDPTEATTSAQAKTVQEEYHRFIGFKPALAACSLNWHSDLPPTHALSTEEFRACMPKFLGAHLTCQTASEAGLNSSDTPATALFTEWMRTAKPVSSSIFELSDTFEMDQNDMPNVTDSLFSDLPKPHDEVELAFARFQALDAHGQTKQSLLWARYVACRLLYLSPQFLADLEKATFEVVGTSIKPTKSVFNQSDSGSLGDANSESNVGRVYDLNARRQKKVAGNTVVHGSSAYSSSLPAGSQTNGENSRLKKPNPGAAIMQDYNGVPENQVNSKALTWSTKVSHLLDQIRYLMECLTRSYNETVSNVANLSSTNRITSSGRTLLTFRGPDPTLVNLHLDETASPVAQQSGQLSFQSIKDEWTCIDIELAFRLGFYGLSLPRPPTQSPTLEVRLFDQEVALVSRLCRLPLHAACPHVLKSIRYEANMLARSLSTYHTDIIVPYNLAGYIFHQLVGTRPTSEVLASLTNPIPTTGLPDSHGSFDDGGASADGASSVTGLNRAGTSRTQPSAEREPSDSSGGDNSNSDSINSCPVLATGAILAGPDIPLVVSSHRCRKDARDSWTKSSSYLETLDLAALQDAVVSDAELGFLVTLTVIGLRSRVPQAAYPYFIEGQWAHHDALVVYLLRHYRDDVAKLDRILVHLIDLQYNPHFKAPPLWACLSLPPRDLMRYDVSDQQQAASQPGQTENREVPSTELSTFVDVPNQLHTLPLHPSASLPLMLSTPGFGSGHEHQTLDHLDVAVNPVVTTHHSEPSQPANSEDLPTQHVAESTAPTVNSPSNVTEAVDSTIVNSEQGFIDSVEEASQDRTTSQFNLIHCNETRIYDPLSTSEDTDTVSDSKTWSDTFRCAVLRNSRNREHHSVGLAAVDTSAPETTSSDNSPAACRRHLLNPKTITAVTTGTSGGGPASPLPSGPSNTLNNAPSIPQTPTPGMHADTIVTRGHRKRMTITINPSVSAFSSFSDDDDDDDYVPIRQDYPYNTQASMTASNLVHQVTTATAPNTHVNQPTMPTSQPEPVQLRMQTENDCHGWPAHIKRPPPQPLSDSIAFHTFHLAKLVRKLAGGPSANGSVFVAEPEANATVHRNLQLVAFQIGLYGLGVYNGLTPSWHNRTYSRNGGWVSQQVFEIGLPAACILYHSWQQHMTAAELAGIALQLSHENNRMLVDIAVELCLASLTFCTTLRPHEIYRALAQCEEHSSQALERGLLKIEQADTQSSYGILPEIHFFLARSWFSLHQSATEDYKKAVEISREQQKDLAIQHQQQAIINSEHNDGDASKASGPTSTAHTSADGTTNPTVQSTSSSVCSFGAGQYSASFPNGIEQSSFPISSWSILPPSSSQSPYSSISLSHHLPAPLGDQAGQPVYRSISMSHDPALGIVPPMSSVYQPMFYYPTLPANMQQPQLMSDYGQSQPRNAQSTLGPSHGQNTQFHYDTQTPQMPHPVLNTPAQLQCVQNGPYQFRTNTGMSLPGSRMPSIPPPPPHLTLPQPNFAPPSGFVPSNPQLVNSVSQLPNTTYAPQLQPVHANVSSQPQAVPPIMPQFGVIYQMSRDQTAGNEQASYTVNAPVSGAASIAENNNGTAPPSSYPFNAPANLASLSATRFIAPIGGAHHRLASMSNASSSVVVHPASSDRASTASETDSSRPTESVVEDPNATNISAGHAQTFTATSLADNTLAASSASTIQDLEAKSRLYLRRAYLCATSAIKKIFLTQPTGSFGAQSSPMPPGRSVRGSKHHHSMQQRQKPNAQQTSDSFVPGSGLVNSCVSSEIDNVSAMTCNSVGGGASAQISTSEFGRLRLPITTDTQLVKVWEVNILWALDVASGLGPSFVHEYCNLVLQCVQHPLLMKHITNKVIEYFKNQPTESGQVATSTAPIDAPAQEGAVRPCHLPIDAGINQFYTCMPPKAVQSNQIQAPYYPPVHPSFPYMDGRPPFPTTLQPSGTWSTPGAMNQPIDGVLPFPSSNFANPYSLTPMWSAPFGSCSTLTPQQQQEQFNNMITLYQQLGLHQDQLQASALFLEHQRMAACVPPPPPADSAGHPFIHVPFQAVGHSASWPVVSAASLRSGEPLGSNTTIHVPPPPPAPTSLFPMSEQACAKQSVNGRDLVEKLINRTHALFHRFIEQRLQYIGQGQAEWDEFVDLILKAYNVHLSMPATDCGLHWNNLLTRIRRHHKCGAALWQRILAGIQTADLKRSG
ncbi:Zinc finger SWIM domain-containing protein 8 [Clonorchis sinensis]|uniref:Zinc finger SWIM domain-containing protein 8 n=1 Tax=Clonorchis sinensis TaxID=79923 RepID=A0A419QG02_CLOSI|nr:Zinc finger SWIM domain-containing protein 8 [Clonorchis sinensis]